MSSREPEERDWAQQIPDPHPFGPYQDYGWGPGESVLPEFRDPSVHRMPYDEEFNELQPSRYHRKLGQRSNRPSMAQARPWDEPGPYTGVGPQGYVRSDERIREEVCDRLTRHGSIDARNMQVHVQAGEVTLEGTVESRTMKRMAEDTVDSVSGVKDVHNRLNLQKLTG
jgi:hypothetical protein